MEAVNTWDLHADPPAPGPDTGLRGQDFLVQGHIPDTLLSLLSLRTCHFLDTLEACKSATCLGRRPTVARRLCVWPGLAPRGGRMGGTSCQEVPGCAMLGSQLGHLL